MMSNGNTPEGATHKHEGDSEFFPHYIKVVKGEVSTWVTGLAGGDHWNTIPSHDLIEKYTKLEKAK